MGELGELRNKVNQAVERLSSAYDTRRRQSQGLMTLLTDLESKYAARNEELEHSKQRIEALARENADLSDLVEKLVLIVDTTVTSDDEDALFRASVTATDLVADWSGPGDATKHVHQPEGTGPEETGEISGQIDQEHDEPKTTADDDVGNDIVSSADNERNLDDLIAAELGHDPAAEAFAGVDPALGFEDVSDEELAAERLDGDPEALAALLNTPLTNGIDDDVTVQEIDEPFAVTEIVDDEAAAQKTVELDADGIDMPEIDMTDVEATGLDALDAFDPNRELLAADLDIPEIAREDDELISRIDSDEDTESSIRAMMARLEKAAARARAHSEESTEAEAIEAPAVAVGGRS